MNELQRIPELINHIATLVPYGLGFFVAVTVIGCLVSTLARTK